MMDVMTCAYLLLGIASAAVLIAHALLRRKRLRDYRLRLMGVDVTASDEREKGL